jgi:hypothetical protein
MKWCHDCFLVVLVNRCFGNESSLQNFIWYFQDSARARRQGAIIESMHHHGKGVYSGTFSGMVAVVLMRLCELCFQCSLI